MACPVAQVPPPNRADSELPSILIGRPSRCFTSKLQDEAHPRHVVAYQLATPGIISSDPTSKGIAFCTGARHPESPRAATVKPMAARKSRRVVSSPAAEEGNPPGNSAVRRGPFRNSSGLFQYAGTAGPPIWTRCSFELLQCPRASPLPDSLILMPRCVVSAWLLLSQFLLSRP